MTTITNCRPTHGTLRKRHRKLTGTCQQEDNLSNHISISLSLPLGDVRKTRKESKYCKDCKLLASDKVLDTRSFQGKNYVTFFVTYIIIIIMKLVIWLLKSIAPDTRSRCFITSIKLIFYVLKQFVSQEASMHMMQAYNFK